ncbi:MAG: WbqC family protein [Bacteroidales bacterium]|jgi:hypothetical protein|nr:WbqC family protein [Bacteroidales bacterium]
MPGEILLSTAYFPPASYFALIRNSDKVLIEQEENYPRQTFRNRCNILAAGGVMVLSVPVSREGRIKIPTRDVTIDYSKRWQQVHLRALISAYNRSPYFQYYFEYLETVLLKNHKFLLDLNNELLLKCMEIINIIKPVSLTSSFAPVSEDENDYRYKIKPGTEPLIRTKPYIQVFGNNSFVPGLSILDLIFNTGPEAADYL